MAISRRTFISGSAVALSAPAIASNGSSAAAMPQLPTSDVFSTGTPAFDPIIDVDASAIRRNVAEVARACAGKPIMAVVKNNAYGLGLTTVGPILDDLSEIAGLAVVKPDQAIALRDAGVRKPVLLMGMFDESEGEELIARDIHLAPWADGAVDSLSRLAAKLNRRVAVHLYLDTGMGRVGMPYRRALPWIEALAAEDAIQIDGTFMGFTEEEFDHEQLRRFLALAGEVREKGINLGHLHAASSHGLFFRPDAYLDMVRPGLVLYGAYPGGAQDVGLADLRPAFRLHARVVRVERLEPGDSVSYGRNYVAERPTWVATLPVGHADGYPRSAVNGCQLLVNGSLYSVIGAVSASHTIVEIGDEKRVEVGDQATFIGPDDPAVYPNTVAERAGISVYDVLMHLSSRLPKHVIGG